MYNICFQAIIDHFEAQKNPFYAILRRIKTGYSKLSTAYIMKLKELDYSAEVMVNNRVTPSRSVKTSKNCRTNSTLQNALQQPHEYSAIRDSCENGAFAEHASVGAVDSEVCVSSGAAVKTSYFASASCAEENLECFVHFQMSVEFSENTR